MVTFHSWAFRCGVEFRKGEYDGAFGERLIARLRADVGLCGRDDAVLIDEAQDWPCSWFQCARVALREPETGDLLIVGDGSQSLYRKWDFTWAEASINASGHAAQVVGRRRSERARGAKDRVQGGSLITVSPRTRRCVSDVVAGLADGRANYMQPSRKVRSNRRQEAIPCASLRDRPSHEHGDGLFRTAGEAVFPSNPRW
jgi:hypothetical protein